MQIYYNTPISIKRNNLKKKKTKTKTEKKKRIYKETGVTGNRINLHGITYKI